MKRIFYLAALIVLSFSCKKDSTDTTIPEKTKYDLLINKKWTVIAISGYNNGVFVPDDFTSLPDYAKDDYIYFYPNLNYESNSGPLKSPNFPEQIRDHGLWQLTTSDQFIILTSQVPGNETLPLKILELTESKFSYQIDDTQNNLLVTYSFIPVP